jgi:hypothetical protein
MTEADRRFRALFWRCYLGGVLIVAIIALTLGFLL